MAGDASAGTTEPTRRRILTPVRLRQLLTGRGPAGIKFGQFLAIRPDLVPQEFCEELLLLVDQVPPFSWTLAREILLEDLGAPPEELFAWISPRPTAAGSLAQVHAARTFRGETVAVKVKREGVEHDVHRELRRARWVTRALEAMGVVRVVSPTEVVAEFERWLEQELDFEHELTNLIRMAERQRTAGPMRIPHPHPELSGRRVVTSELLEGVPFSHLIRLVRTGKADELAIMGFDRVTLAENLLMTVLQQVFEDQLFHADPHPGNLLALRENVIGFVDFGLVDDLDENIRSGLTGYISAVFALDTEQMYRGLTELLVPGKSTDLQAFHDDFVAATRTWISERTDSIGFEPGARSPIARYLIAVLDAARRNDLRIPASLLSVYRALLTAEAIADELGGGVGLEHVGRNFFGRLQVRRTLASIDASTALVFLSNALALAQEAPGALNRILADLADDRFTLDVRTSESRDDRRRADTRVKLVAAAVLTGALSLLLIAAAQQPFLSGKPVAVVLLVLLGLSLLNVVRLWRRLS